MRTTLNIDDDVPAAAKELAQHERSTAGRVISRLLRCSLADAGELSENDASQRNGVAGFRPFPAKHSKNVTNDQISNLLDAEGI